MDKGGYDRATRDSRPSAALTIDAKECALADAEIKRACSACKEELPLADYGRSAGYRDGYRRQCRKCRTSYERKRRESKHYKRPSTRVADRRRRLRDKYCLSEAEYSQMLEAQHGVCKICSKPPAWKYGVLVVDHCHETGRVRGLLCHNCNRGLALLGDQPEPLLKVVDYLIGASHGY